ncbi:MAG: hypothetical protein R3E68_09160 [Burkholderiaceae bacterium]
MPVKAIHLGISSVVAMGVAVTAFGVSSPPSTGAPAFQTVVYKLVVPSSAGISLDTVQRSFVVNEGDTLERLLLLAALPTVNSSTSSPPTKMPAACSNCSRASSSTPASIPSAGCTICAFRWARTTSTWPAAKADDW